MPTYVYIVCIFKTLVTDKFAIDFEVLCSKLQAINYFKMKKKDKSVPISC